MKIQSRTFGTIIFNWFNEVQKKQFQLFSK